MLSSEIFQLDWQLAGYHLTHLLIAYLLALPIGWEREQSKRHFGLRTFPLVADVSSAASIWNTGAIGLAVAFDRFEIAVVLAALNAFTLLFLVGSRKRLKTMTKTNNRNFYSTPPKFALSKHRNMLVLT